MPYYEYKCTGCKEIEEYTFPMGQAPDMINDIHDCYGGILKRIYLPAAISFRGSGFYSSDNRTKRVQE